MQKRVARVTVLLLLLAGMVAASFVLVTIERRSTSSVTTATQALDDVTRTYLRTELDEVARVRWLTLGVVAAIFVLGLVALTPTSRVPAVSDSVSALERTTATLPIESAPEPLHVDQPHRVPDLTSLAVLCTDLSRVATTDSLPALLGRSAAALDASGLIVWVGTGDQLWPLMAHGYPAGTLSRLGPVGRADDNAAATAWRTGERVIVSGTGGSAAAIVIPVPGIDTCLGVLAFEVPDGREHDPATHAVGALLAAQLATIVPTAQTETAAVPAAGGPVEPEHESRVQSA